MTKTSFIYISGIATLCLTLPSLAKVTQSNRKGAWTTEQQLAGFKLPEGFIIELVASEKNGLINPIDLTFDDAGRLWTQTAQMYPLDPVTGQGWNQNLKMMQDPKLGEKYPKVLAIQKLYKLETRGKDKILIVDQPTQQAKGPLQVWADGLSIPQSILPYKDGCYVAHGSEMFFLQDTNNDGKQDKVNTVMSGFGMFDTHTMAHSLVRGPGGWVNFSHGALNSGKVKVHKSGQELEVTYAKNLRFNLAGTKLEVLNIARDNVWGYQVQSNGQWYATSANDNGLSVLPMEDQTGINGIGGQKIRNYQPMLNRVHKFRVGGTGISGLAFSEDGEHGFPKEWKNVAILANPITHSINCVRIERLPNGTIKTEHLPDLLHSKDDWFRPVNIEFGPDGCLYIADWYNKIVSHNEVSTTHPDRDRKHGRIWRIRHKSQKPFSIPNVAKAKNADLIKHLNGGSLWEKRAAWHQIVDRKANELAPQLKQIANDKSIAKDVRILALWSLEGLGSYDEATIKSAIADKDGDIRREVIRSLATYQLDAAKVANLVTPFLNDTNCMVRSQVIRTLEELDEAKHATIALLIEASKPAASDNKFGGNYERNFERFLTRKALESYPKELQDYLAKGGATKHPAENILWALQSLPVDQRTSVFVNIWKSASSSKIDKNTFIAVTKMLQDKSVRDAVAPTFSSRSKEMLKLAIENVSDIDGPELARFYIAHINKLLDSKEITQQKEALELIQALRSPFHTKKLVVLYNAAKDNNDRLALLNVLSHDKTLSAEFYREQIFNDSLSFDIRLHALAATVIKAPINSSADLQQWLPHLTPQQLEIVVTKLAFSKAGSDIIKGLWEKSYLPSSAWSYEAASLTLAHNKNDWRGKDIFTHANKIEQVDKAARQKKIKEVVKASETRKPNLQIGAAMFQSCLSCHSQGGKGNTFAPPLDGGKNRDYEHLLTAVISPNDAFEGAFGLYYAVRKDGHVEQGYLVKHDVNGIVIGKQGGITAFISSDNLHSHGSINGRSFMPGLYGKTWSVDMLADVASYLKTPK